MFDGRRLLSAHGINLMEMPIWHYGGHNGT